MTGLTTTERATLLEQCGCGHTINDHGSLAGCWVCLDDNGKCDVRFEALLTERVGRIVGAQVAQKAAESVTDGHQGDASAEVAPVATDDANGPQIGGNGLTEYLLEDVLLEHMHMSGLDESDIYWNHGCSCGWTSPYDTGIDHLKHQADAVRAWLAEVAQRDEVVEAVAEAVSWSSGEFTRYSDDAHADHNRCSWRGDGHGDVLRDEFRKQGTAALAAFVAAVTEVGK